jgi:hypothetical protein
MIDLEKIYKEGMHTNHAAALTAVYEQGKADGRAEMTASAALLVEAAAQKVQEEGVRQPYRPALFKPMQRDVDEP